MKRCLDTKQPPSDSELQKIPPFIFCRWLSGSPMTVLASNQLNLYYNMPIQNQFNLIRSAFGGKVKFIPYPKNIKEDSDKELIFLAKHYKISLPMAKEYKELMSKDEYNEIIQMYMTEELR